MGRDRYGQAEFLQIQCSQALSKHDKGEDQGDFKAPCSSHEALFIELQWK